MNWTHDMQSRLVKDPPEIDLPVLYDNNGNQILTEFGTGLTCDAWNQLVGVEGFDGEGGWVGVNEYLYDALGRRFLKLDGEDWFFGYVYSAFGTGGGQLLVDWVVGEGPQYLTWGSTPAASGGEFALENGLVSRDTISEGGDMLERVYVETEANWNLSSTLRGEAGWGGAGEGG